MKSETTTSYRRTKLTMLSTAILEKRYVIIEVISALYILLFLYTALNKTLEIESTVNVLKRTPVASGYASAFAWSIVAVEYAISALLFVPRTKFIGLFISLGLMLMFSAYISYMKIFVPDLPCSCGGVISKMTWTQHLIFNVLFIVLAVTAILLRKHQEIKHT